MTRARWPWAALPLLALGVAVTARHARRLPRRIPPPGPVLPLPDGPTHTLLSGPPTAPPLLLIHGSDGVTLDWPLCPLWPLLDGAYLIAPDRPGHGYTPARPGTPVTLDLNVRRLTQLLDHLNVPQVTVLGHSYGAAVALALAARHPERVSALVLIAPLSHPARGLTRPLAFVPLVPGLEALLTRALLLPVGRVVARIEGRRAFHPYPVPPMWHTLMLAFSRRRAQVHALAGENRTLSRELAALQPHYPALTVPVTVLAGRQDRLSPPAQHADLLTRLLPDATQLDLPGGGHQLHWTHPQEVAGAVRAALGVASRSSGPPDA